MSYSIFPAMELRLRTLRAIEWLGLIEFSHRNPRYSNCEYRRWWTRGLPFLQNLDTIGTEFGKEWQSATTSILSSDKRTFYLLWSTLTRGATGDFRRNAIYKQFITVFHVNMGNHRRPITNLESHTSISTWPRSWSPNMRHTCKEGKNRWIWRAKTLIGAWGGEGVADEIRRLRYV